jgi:hypothetical protein
MADVLTGKAKISLIGPPGPGNQRGPAPPAIQTQNATSVVQTRALASFAVNVPGETAGFQFLQAGVMRQPRQAVVMTFVGEGKRIGFQIFQAPVSQYQATPGGQPTYLVVADNLTEVNVGGAVGARSTLPANQAGVANTSLVWEKGDMLFHLIAQGLSDQDLTRIATSLYQ